MNAARWKTKNRGKLKYILEAGVIPTKVGPGKFEGDALPFRIFDRLDLEYPVVKTAYRELMRGEVSMPWIDLDVPIIPQTELASLFDVGKNSARITLRNTGNRPLRLSTWETATEQEREIALKENTCGNIQLEPNGRCELTIIKSTAKPLSKTFYSWGSTGTTGEFEVNVSLSIRKYDNGETSIEVRNR